MIRTSNLFFWPDLLVDIDSKSETFVVTEVVSGFSYEVKFTSLIDNLKYFNEIVNRICDSKLLVHFSSRAEAQIEKLVEANRLLY